MAKFADTPDWRRGAWDARTQRMEFPPTPAQVKYLKKLCRGLGLEYEAPRTKREAQSRISRLAERYEARTGIPQGPRERRGRR